MLLLVLKLLSALHDKKSLSLQVRFLKFPYHSSDYHSAIFVQTRWKRIRLTLKIIRMNPKNRMKVKRKRRITQNIPVNRSIRMDMVTIFMDIMVLRIQMSMVKMPLIHLSTGRIIKCIKMIQVLAKKPAHHKVYFHPMCLDFILMYYEYYKCHQQHID